MNIVSSNDGVAVIDLEYERRRRTQTQTEKHRESILGPCPSSENNEVLEWVCQRITADVLPDGSTRLLVLDDGPFSDEAMQPVWRQFYDLLREVHELPSLKEIPNGCFLRVRLEVVDDWSEHPLNPENEWNQASNMSEPRDFEPLSPEEQLKLDECARQINARLGNPPEEV
jgi:hypothetical protein